MSSKVITSLSPFTDDVMEIQIGDTAKAFLLQNISSIKETGLLPFPVTLSRVHETLCVSNVIYIDVPGAGKIHLFSTIFLQKEDCNEFAAVDTYEQYASYCKARHIAPVREHILSQLTQHSGVSLHTLCEFVCQVTQESCWQKLTH